MAVEDGNRKWIVRGGILAAAAAALVAGWFMFGGDGEDSASYGETETSDSEASDDAVEDEETPDTETETADD